MTSPNPILEEIYEARDKLLADAGGDLHQYLEGVRKRESASGRLLTPDQQRAMQSIPTLGKGIAAVDNQPLPTIEP